MSGKNTEIKTIYYKDEQHDEFSGFDREAYKIPDKFRYVHKSIFWRAAAFIVYRLIMTPIAFLYCKIKFHLKIVNRKVMKPFRREGVFLFRNHTLVSGDAYIPSLVTFPQASYVVVNAENMSTPGTRSFLMMSGALPIPSSPVAFRKMLDAVEKRILQKNCVTVYPEAHIWPYYTKIRRFPASNVSMAVKFGAPVFVATTTFQKYKNKKTPAVTVYVDGPIYPDMTLTRREASEKLCDGIYETMCRRAENSTYEVIHYEKAEEIK